MGTLECPVHDSVIHLSFWTTGVWSSWIHVIHSGIHSVLRLRVVPHFSSGIVERAKRERAWNSPHARKGDTGGGIQLSRWPIQQRRRWCHATSITLSRFSVSHVYLSLARQFLVLCTLRAVVSPGRTLRPAWRNHCSQGRFLFRYFRKFEREQKSWH